MDIFKDLKIIERIKDINQLEEMYSFEELQYLYKKTQELDIVNNKLFEKTLHEDFSKEKLQKIWNNKNSFQKFNIILLKALITIEKNKILIQTEKITKKLSEVIENVN